jgi:hercynine metabolism protein
MSSSSPGDWFSQLERQLEQQLDSFLRANPAQEQLLQQQEQRERQQRLRRRRLELQAGAERQRSELLALASEISQWQRRVERARSAGAEALAERAEAHLAELMARGRDRWQALSQLGESFRQVEQELQQMGAEATTANGAQPPQSPADDLERAWSAFEADQELMQLRRRQEQQG